MANSNTRIVLASHPPGEPTEADFRIETVPVPDPDDGQVLIRTIHLSLDGYIDRGVRSCPPPDFFVRLIDPRSMLDLLGITVEPLLT